MLAKAKMDAICTLVTDGTHDSPKLQRSGIPFIKGKHISQGFIDFDNCDFITEADHADSCRRVRPQAGDVLFSNIGSVGDTARVSSGRDFSIKNVALFRPDPDKVDARYFYYLVVNPMFKQSMLSLKSGSAQPFITLGSLRGYETSYHTDRAKQRRIASILSAYDDLIENNTRRIAILEEMARRIYEEWFVRFRFPGHENVQMVESELGLVPEGWDVVRLDQVLVLQRGFDLPKQDRTDGPIPIISATGGSGTHHEHRVKGPGVVTGRSGSLGVVMYVEGDFWPLNTTLWVKEFVVGSALFAYYVLRSIDLAGFNSGAAVPTLNRNDVHGLPVARPTADVLTRFDEVVSPIMKLKRRLEMANANLRTTRDLLLPKLISGELDVSALPEPEAIAA